MCVCVAVAVAVAVAVETVNICLMGRLAAVMLPGGARTRAVISQPRVNRRLRLCNRSQFQGVTV